MSAFVFDKKKLATLIEDLQTVSGMGVTFWNPETCQVIILTSKILSPFCAYVQTCPAMEAECHKCEQKVLQEVKADLKTHNFICHAGLNECASPIISNGQLLGVIMIGQVIDPEEDGGSLIKKKAWFEQNGFNIDLLKQLYLSLPRVSAKKRTAVIHILQAMAGFVQLDGIVKYVELSHVKRIEKYIDEHISEPISLDDMAEALNISKSSICHMIKTEKDVTLTKMINYKRIENVKQDLSSGVSITDASINAGFSTVSYCSRVFYSITGMRPGEYRNKILYE